MTADAVEAPMTASRGGKSQAAFRTISEVADELDVAQHVLRFWESKFPQVRPLKRGGGRRYYRPEDIELLRDIRALLYDEGYTIKGAQKLLRQRRARPPAAPATKPPATAAAAGQPARPEAPAGEPFPMAAGEAADEALSDPGDTPRQHQLDAPALALPAEPAAAPDSSASGLAPNGPPLATTTAEEDLERLRQVRDELATLRRDLRALLAVEGN